MGQDVVRAIRCNLQEQAQMPVSGNSKCVALRSLSGHWRGTAPLVQVDLAIKVAGIHWWYKSRSHAAEMTAGYYNFLARDGYKPIAKMLRKRGVGLSFTCIEMSDDENPDSRHSSPERK